LFINNDECCWTLLVITIGPAITITLGATLLMYGQGCQRLSCPRGQRRVSPIKGTVGEILLQSYLK
jgi:hypothetical protein